MEVRRCSEWLGAKGSSRLLCRSRIGPDPSRRRRLASLLLGLFLFSSSLLVRQRFPPWLRISLTLSRPPARTIGRSPFSRPLCTPPRRLRSLPQLPSLPSDTLLKGSSQSKPALSPQASPPPVQSFSGSSKAAFSLARLSIFLSSPLGFAVRSLARSSRLLNGLPGLNLSQLALLLPQLQHQRQIIGRDAPSRS